MTRGGGLGGNATGPSDFPRSMVVVQPGISGPPIYSFHALGGSVAPYGELASHLGRNRLVIGLQAIGLVGGESPDRTVPDMAHRYATEISADPPNGRVVFLGYSLGGVLALETARLLRNLLDEAPLLIAVDSDPEYRSPGPDGALSILAHQVLNLDLPVGPLSTLPRAEALAAVRAAATEQRKLPRRFDLARLGRMLDVCRANEHAATSYRTRPYPGSVVSVRSVAPSAAGESGRDGWSGLVDHLVVRRVPGDHHSIMSAAGYPRLAAEIRDLLTASIAT